MDVLRRAWILLGAASLAACSRAPPSGPTCVKACTTLATFDREPGPLTLDETSAYFQTVPDDHHQVSLLRTPLAGGAPEVLGSAQSFATGRVAVDATAAYWANVVPDEGTGTLEWVALYGGARATLARGLTLPSSVAVSAVSAYVSMFDDGIEEVPIAGGAATRIGPMGSIDLVAHGANLVSVGSFFGQSQIQRVSLVDGSVLDVATVDGDITDLAVDDTTIYWVSHLPPSADPDGGDLWHVSTAPLGGGTVSDAAVLANVGGIAVDAEHLYFTDRETGAVTRASRGGGDPEALAAAWPDIRWVAVDDAHVYFVATGKDGRFALMATPK